ncbi:sulfotransferase domain-containing protein [archaeon]|nr:sulfotransferase domain-containing protein [archaeon]
MNKLNLFIVGKPKSGTSALHNFLDQHPEIFMSKPKEPHFFCKDFHKLSDKFHKRKTKNFYEFRTIKEYSNLFKKTNKKIIGEASTNYLYSKTSAKDIYNFNKNAKIIIMLREPVAFLYSLHSQYVNEDVENKNFEDALKLESTRKKNYNLLSKNLRCPSYVFYSERIKYAEQIERYLKIFPKKNIKIILFDNFKKDNEKIYKEVLQFLEIDDSFTPNFKIIHGSKKPKSKILNKFFRNPYLKNIPKSILPPKIYDKLQLKVQKVLMKKEKRKLINLKTKSKLMKKFKPEVIKLNKLLKEEGFIKEDLIKLWGYDKV